MESLWLLAVFLIPLVFFDRDYAVSEAVIGYVEVPKIALLRLLAGAMAVLWLVEWGIRGRFPLWATSGLRAPWLKPSAWKPRLVNYFRGRHDHWLILAVGFYLATTLLSTILSGSFSISLWGEIPGQDGYASYTVAAYVLLFGVIATHLRTRSQLWRFLSAIAAMGVLVGSYAVLQHYGHDIFDLSESTGGRTTAFMGNTIFAAAVMLMTIPITLTAAVAALLNLPETGGTRLGKVGRSMLAMAVLDISALALAVQLLGLTFTFSRGPWLGTISAVVALVGLAAVFGGPRVTGRIAMVLGLAAVFALALLQSQGSIAMLNLGPWLGALIATAALLVSGMALVSWRAVGRPILVLGLAGAVSAAVAVFLIPSLTEGGGASTSGRSGLVAAGSDGIASEVSGQFLSIRQEVSSGLTGGRGTHWRVSLLLIKNHPWFEFDRLSLRWLRPLVGYGPDLFRYTYLLESRLEGPELYPLEPDHAHNYFIHQTVEQGFLGLVSILGVFAAVFFGTSYQLHRRGMRLAPVHVLILACLAALVLGRFLEMMVGVARVSDLTVFWALLGAFAALPAVMGPSEIPVQGTAQNHGGQTEDRSKIGHLKPPGQRWQWVWRLGVVAWLTFEIVMLTWFKGVNYAWAAVKAGEAVAHWQQNDRPSTLADLDRAIELAPDVPVYHNWRASVYSAYRFDRDGPRERQCSLQRDLPYQACLAAMAYQNYRQGSERSPFYYRSRLELANSAADLNLHEEATLNYQETLALVPASWGLRNKLAEAYIRQGRLEDALSTLQESLAITNGKPISAEAHFLRGIAYQDLDKLEESAESLISSLELGLSEVSMLRAHVALADVYKNLDRPIKAAESFAVLAASQLNFSDLAPLADDLRRRAEAYADSGQVIQAASILLILGAAHHDAAQPKLASPILHRGLELSSIGASESPIDTKSLEISAEFLFLLGKNYGALGAQQISAQYLLRSADSYEESGQHDLAAGAISAAAVTYRGLGELELAAELYQASAEAYEKLGKSGPAAVRYSTSAKMYEELGEFSAAGKLFFEAGEAFRGRKDYERSVREFRRSTEAYETWGSPESGAHAYFRLGLAYRGSGDLEKSAEAIELAIHLSGSEFWINDARRNLEEIYSALQRTEVK